MTNAQDTLIVIIADHSHTFVIAGYSYRGNPILGLCRGANKDGSAPADSPCLGADEKPYTTLGYWNGPGGIDGERPDLTNIDTTDPDYVQQAVVPMSSETHSGEDIVIFAYGPMAHLLQGITEQNYIFHVMDYAGDIRGRAAANMTKVATSVR
jgi:alkaline phosphatase